MRTEVADEGDDKRVAREVGVKGVYRAEFKVEVEAIGAVGGRAQTPVNVEGNCRECAADIGGVVDRIPDIGEPKEGGGPLEVKVLLGGVVLFRGS